MRRKTLPQVSPKVANELKPLVTAIKEIIETGEGVRGDPLDRKITLRDLVDGGIVKIKGGLSPNNPGSLEPSPPPPNLSVPPAPTGFSAIGGFDGRIDLTWDIPGSLYSNHAYTNIYRAEEDNFANAILVGREAGAFYTDVVRDDAVPTPYYYWISFTSTGNIEGPLNATAGTMAQALDIDYIVDLLDGKISESELANELLTPIQSIPSIQATLDDYGIRIPSLETTVGNHAIQIPNLQTTVDDLSNRVPLIEGDVLDSQQDITALQSNLTVANQNIATNATAVNQLTTRVTDNEGDISAQSTQITNLSTTVSNLDADVTANSTAVSQLDTRVTTTENSISTQAGQITSLQSSMNDLTIPAFDASNAYAVGELFRYNNVVYEVIATQSQPNATPPNATYYAPKTDYETIADTVSANAGAVASLDTRVTAAEGTITSQATDITGLQADLSTAEGDISANSTAISQIDTRVTTAEGSISTQSSDITQLQNDLTLTQGDVTANANATSSLATRVTATEGNITSLSGDIVILKSDVDSLETTTSANSGAVSALETRVTSTENSITTQSEQLVVLENTIERGTAGFDVVHVWHFDAGAEGWFAINATLSVANGILSLASDSNDPMLISQGGLAIDGANFDKIRVRVRRTAGAGWQGTVYYTTSEHSFSSSYRKNIELPGGYQNGQWVELEWDMADLSEGGLDWATSEILSIRFDFGTTVSDVFEIDWIAVGRPGPGGSSSAVSKLSSEVTEINGLISSQSADITSLSDSVDALESGAQGTAESLTLLSNRVTDTEDGLESVSVSITNLQNSIEDPESGLTALSQAYSSLDSRVVVTENDISSISSDLTTLSTTVDGNTASLEQKASTEVVEGLDGEIQSIKSEWFVKLDVNGLLSGIALGNDGDSSELVVASDAVYFIDPGQSIQPFSPGTNYSSMAAVRDTQLVFGYAEVEGFKRFVINVPAYIPEGYIESGMVGAISFGKITTDTGVPVTTVSGKLKADYIDVDNLAVASAATFYGDAQSGNYAAGSAGWRIQQSGTVEFYNGTFRGRIEANTGYISQNLQIGGTSQDVGDVLQMAQDADAGLSIVDSWKKPGYTLIDGNKIFTGDAYVDTLQIKGEAVTVSAAQSHGRVILNSYTYKVISISYNHGETYTLPVFIWASGMGFGNYNGEGEYLGDHFPIIYVDNVRQQPNGIRILLTPGTHIVELRYEQDGTTDSGFLSIMGVKK